MWLVFSILARPIMPLSILNIEAELSYSYLHAVAGRAGMCCKKGDSHDDDAGVDAEVSYRGDLGHRYKREQQINVQLKATKKHSGSKPGHLTYFLQGVKRYNDLRANESDIPRLLVVLFLPDQETNWLEVTVEELVLRNAAYWVSLKDAPATQNEYGATIYLPKTNLLTPENLIELVRNAANNALPTYLTP